MKKQGHKYVNGIESSKIQFETSNKDTERIVCSINKNETNTIISGKKGVKSQTK